jgi:hypothetical protein
MSKKVIKLNINKQNNENHPNAFQSNLVQSCQRLLHLNVDVICNKIIPNRVKHKSPGNKKLGGIKKAADTGKITNRIKNSTTR